jgi:type II secretion system-associated lipoprotein
VEKKKVEALNKKLQAEVLVARTDILPDFAGSENDIIFKNGTRLKCWIEASEEWLRIKAISAEQKREQARGQTIVYIFRDDLEKEEKRDKKARKEQVPRVEERAIAYLKLSLSRLTGYAL